MTALKQITLTLVIVSISLKMMAQSPRRCEGIEVRLTEPYCKSCLYELDYILAKIPDLNRSLYLVLEVFSYDSLDRDILRQQMQGTLALDYEITITKINSHPNINLSETPIVTLVNTCDSLSNHNFGYFNGSKKATRRLLRLLRKYDKRA
jgi:hypothetical protein